MAQLTKEINGKEYKGFEYNEDIKEITINNAYKLHNKTKFYFYISLLLFC